MNSRQRVLAAIKNEHIDRVPYDFWAEDSTLNKIYSAIGCNDKEKLLKKLNVDIRHIDAIAPREKYCGGFFQNYWGERYVYKQTEWGCVREDVPGALSNAKSFHDIKSFDWPEPGCFDYSNIERLCRINNEYAIMYGFADIWQRPSLVRGMQNAFSDMILKPEWVHFLSRKFTDFYKEDYSRAYKESGKRIDIFLIISDLGGQERPLISPEMFDEFIAPYVSELTEHIHNMGAFVMFHSCGMIFPFIERFIEIGIDIIDPIQPVSKSMGLESLAENFKGRICFHGGIDIQDILPNGSPEDVKKEVIRYSEMLGKNGGYICCPAHLFQPDVPVENILAFYDALA